jgi:hypothetical protein
MLKSQGRNVYRSWGSPVGDSAYKPGQRLVITVSINDRNATPKLLPNGSIAFYPANAGYDGSTWSSCGDSFYTILEMPEENCSDLLNRRPTWLDQIHKPLRFLDSRLTWVDHTICFLKDWRLRALKYCFSQQTRALNGLRNPATRKRKPK